MNGLEITVLLGAAVLAAAVLAPRVRIAAPLLLLFLPVMLFWESLTTSLRSIKRDFRGIMIMSTLLVVATAFAVAGVAHALGVPWAAAVVLGAAVAPPDATAIAALGRSLPHRNFMLLKAESCRSESRASLRWLRMNPPRARRWSSQARPGSDTPVSDGRPAA